MSIPNGKPASLITRKSLLLLTRIPSSGEEVVQCGVTRLTDDRALFILLSRSYLVHGDMYPHFCSAARPADPPRPRNLRPLNTKEDEMIVEFIKTQPPGIIRKAQWEPFAAQVRPLFPSSLHTSLTSGLFQRVQFVT